MVTDQQVKRLFGCLERGWSLGAAAAKARMDEKTARKYRAEWKLPSQLKKDRHWRTREDPFEGVWEKLGEKLTTAPRLQSQTLLRWLMEEYPGRFEERQLRTLQRRIKVWRALKGPSKEVFFPQVHIPGRLSQSDFTHMSRLGVTITGQLFQHLLFHFILTYSNWEDATICYSESFESLSFGLQNAWERLGGVAAWHQTDRMSAAVNKEANPERFTVAYQGLLSHYGVKPRTIGAGKANENGDTEKSHDLLVNEIDQELMLRGSRDFESLEQYEGFLRQILARRNTARKTRFEEEQEKLSPLPARRLDDCKKFTARVTRFSTIHIQHNTYSVHSRLIGERVEVRVYAGHLEVWYAQKKVENLSRLRGTKQHAVQYRHVIDWLVRKPGAFENYRYKADLFPTSYFRMAYDRLTAQSPGQASRQYLAILELAARESESRVNECLRSIVQGSQQLSAALVKDMVLSGTQLPLPTALSVVPSVDLQSYDQLLNFNLEVEYDTQFESNACTGT